MIARNRLSMSALTCKLRLRIPWKLLGGVSPNYQCCSAALDFIVRVYQSYDGGKAKRDCG